MKSDAGYRRTGAVLMLLLIIAVCLHFAGVRGRTAPSEQVAHSVRTAAEAYDVLSRDGIKGRVLVVLDQRTRIVPRVGLSTFMESLDDGSVRPPVTAYNLTSSLIYAGIAREVYFVPPNGLWETELRRAVNRPDSIAESNGVRTRFYGVPVHLVRSESMPVLGEKAVVFIGATVADRYDPTFLSRITDPRVSDVVVRQATE